MGLQRGLQDLRPRGPGLRVQRRAGARPHLHGRQAERPGGQRRLQVHRDRARPRRKRQILRLHRNDPGWPREVEISSLRSSRAQTCKLLPSSSTSSTPLPVCYVISSCCPQPLPPPPPRRSELSRLVGDSDLVLHETLCPIEENVFFQFKILFVNDSLIRNSEPVICLLPTNVIKSQNVVRKRMKGFYLFYLFHVLSFFFFFFFFIYVCFYLCFRNMLFRHRTKTTLLLMFVNIVFRDLYYRRGNKMKLSRFF